MRHFLIRLLFQLLDPPIETEINDEVLQKWLKDQWTHPAFQQYVQIRTKVCNKQIMNMLVLDKERHQGIVSQKFEVLRLAKMAKDAYQRAKH